MVDLTKFSKEDLKKTYEEISTYLKKADETEFEPETSVKRDDQELTELNGKTKKIEDTMGEGKENQALGDGKPGVNVKGETQKSAVKKDYPQTGAPMDQSEEMTGPSEADQMSQIMQLLQEILGKLGNTATATPAPGPTDQIQHSDVPTPPTPTPATTTTDTKGSVTVNVTKQAIMDVLKGMGLTQSVETQKPKVETGHPIGGSDVDTASLVSKYKIEKGMSPTVTNIGKLSWDDCYNLNENMKGSHEGYF